MGFEDGLSAFNDHLELGSYFVVFGEVFGLSVEVGVDGAEGLLGVDCGAGVHVFDYFEPAEFEDGAEPEEGGFLDSLLEFDQDVLEELLQGIL